MKTKTIVVCGFLSVVLVLAFTACSATQGQKLTGTDSFKFTVINNGTAYSVSAGTATEGTVNIPAYYRPNADSNYLPVTEIGDKNDRDGAFAGCKNIIKITIPDSVTSIGNYAFSSCSGLTSVTIPANVTHIYRSAFAGCSSLTSITIPASVSYIGESAFSACDGFTSIAIPEGVTYIGDSAFVFCGNLTSITIPASVTYLGFGAFQSCYSLTRVTFAAGSAITSKNFLCFGSDFEDTLRDAYLAGGAGTYTRSANGDTWTKQP